MFPSRRSILAALAVSALVAAEPAIAATAAIATPEDVVRAIYAFSAGKNGKWDGPSALFDKAALRRFFSNAFVASFEEEQKLTKGELGALDFDPISNSQDPSVHNLTVTQKEATDKAATVEASFTYEEKADGERSLVTYALVNEGGWKVDDIVIVFKGEEGKTDEVFSVKAALAGSIKEIREEMAKSKGKKP
jgi:hypothetical protein